MFSLRYTEVEASGTVVTRRPQSADGNEAESGSPSPALSVGQGAEPPQSGASAAGEADPFLYVFGVCFLSLSGGVNRASSVFHARQFGEWWLETFWDKDDASHAVEYGAELESALEDAGFSGRDVSNMQGAGVSEEDARAIAETRTTEATTVDGTVPEIDAVYRVNDLLSEYTEVLMTASEVYGESYYTYGEGRLYSDDGKGEKQTYLYDGRGSVTAVVSRLEIVCSLSYTDYGEAVGEPPHEFQSFFGYNGEEHDPLTGLQYLRARYYDPAVGSFTTRDPFEGTTETPLSQNGFTYAHNNPVNFSDPSGMFVKPFKVMNDGGSSISKMAQVIRDQQAYEKAQRRLLLPKPPMARPGTPLAASLLPANLEYLKAQTLVYLHEGCDPNAVRARTQSFASVSFDRDKNIESAAKLIHILDECGKYFEGAHLNAIKRNLNILMENVSAGETKMTAGTQNATIAALLKLIDKTEDPIKLANLYRALLIVKEVNAADITDLQLENVMPVSIDVSSVANNEKLYDLFTIIAGQLGKTGLFLSLLMMASRADNILDEAPTIGKSLFESYILDIIQQEKIGRVIGLLSFSSNIMIAAANDYGDMGYEVTVGITSFNIYNTPDYESNPHNEFSSNAGIEYTIYTVLPDLTVKEKEEYGVGAVVHGSTDIKWEGISNDESEIPYYSLNINENKRN